MIPARPAAIVFDCDGTLADTHDCVRGAVDQIFERRGRRCPDALAAAATSGLGLTALQTLIADALDTSAPDIGDELLAALIEAVPRTATALTGAVELVTAAAAVRPVAIASNSPRALLDATLAHTRLAGLAHLTLAGDEVAAPKPAPDLYRTACARLGALPVAAVAFEDSAIGVAAARAAGLTVIGVGAAADSLSAHAHHRHLTDPAIRRWVDDIGADRCAG
ncbi:HAD family phosphatase [Nocardia sp. 2]|uniref:HAD family phosphatase n=1 Tax=Nocardia acididurans TaxID=2802282 RepID=A0ABS1MAK0_9NOCA|nr:HAD family phosphatase [Nocardia acididurans]MBL1077579.1 HAD family phosphatase [Nocardia acididurans]